MVYLRTIVSTLASRLPNPRRATSPGPSNPPSRTSVAHFPRGRSSRPSRRHRRAVQVCEVPRREDFPSRSPTSPRRIDASATRIPSPLPRLPRRHQRREHGHALRYVVDVAVTVAIAVTVVRHPSSARSAEVVNWRLRRARVRIDSSRVSHRATSNTPTVDRSCSRRLVVSGGSSSSSSTASSHPPTGGKPGTPGGADGASRSAGRAPAATRPRRRRDSDPYTVAFVAFADPIGDSDESRGGSVSFPFASGRGWFRLSPPGAAGSVVSPPGAASSIVVPPLAASVVPLSPPPRVCTDPEDDPTRALDSDSEPNSEWVAPAPGRPVGRSEPPRTSSTEMDEGEGDVDEHPRILLGSRSPRFEPDRPRPRQPPPPPPPPPLLPSRERYFPWTRRVTTPRRRRTVFGVARVRRRARRERRHPTTDPRRAEVEVDAMFAPSLFSCRSTSRP